MGKRRGRFMKLKIENMREQHDNILEKEEEEEVVAEHKNMQSSPLLQAKVLMRCLKIKSGYRCWRRPNNEP